MSNNDSAGSREDRSDSTAITFEMMTSRFDEGPEAWTVRMISWADDGEPDPTDVLAEAIVYRAHFDDNWFDRMDSVDQDLASVAEDFYDRDAVELIDEESVFADALVVVYHVEVRENARGDKLSHELVRTIARTFGNDIIALRASSASLSADGELVEDQIKMRALVRHWRSMGFVLVPDSSHTMILPLSARFADTEKR